jgi:hypothetical protein
VSVAVWGRSLLIFFFKQIRSLRLQERTRPDIQCHAGDRLTSHADFLGSRECDPDHALQLFDAITEKAEGLFLWVRIVFDSFLPALANGDGVTDLQKILDSLPAKLEDLFEKILAIRFYSKTAKGAKIYQRQKIAQLSELDLIVATSHTRHSLKSIHGARETEHRSTLMSVTKKAAGEDKHTRVR